MGEWRWLACGVDSLDLGLEVAWGALTGKPTELLKELVQVVPPGARILDPFAGSGTTLVAAQELGRQADGIEREREYCEITRGRLQPVRPADAPRRSAPNARSLAV